MSTLELVHHPDCESNVTGWYHTGDCISGCAPYPSLPRSGFPKRMPAPEPDPLPEDPDPKPE